MEKRCQMLDEKRPASSDPHGSGHRGGKSPSGAPRDPGRGPDSRVRVLEEFAEFGEILPAWEELIAGSLSDTIFLSHPYLTAWWKHFGKGKDPFIILVEQEGSLTAAAPLCVRRTRQLGFTTRVLEIIGTGPVPTRPMGLSDRVDFPVRRGREAGISEILDALLSNRSRWDVVHLKGICYEESPLSAFLEKRDSLKDVPVSATPRYQSPYLSLEGSYDDYARSRSRNFRKQLARHRKMLLAMGPVTIEQGETLPPEKILEETEGISRKSWKGGKGLGLFLDPRIKAFFLDLFTAFRERGWLAVRFLKSGENRIAHEICFRYAGKLYSYDSCFDPGYARVSPGEILTASVLEEAYAAGLREYDLLRGEESYKQRWSRTAREEVEILIAPSGPKAALYKLFQIRLKNWVRKNRFLHGLDNRISGICNKIFTKR